MQAALGIAQLERIEESIRRKREIGQVYNEAFGELANVQLPLPETPYAKNIYWVYGVVLKDASRLDAMEAIEKLKAAGIGSRPFFWPMHEQPVLQKMGMAGNKTHPVAERIARRGLYLPGGLGTNDKELQTVADTFKAILQ